MQSLLGICGILLHIPMPPPDFGIPLFSLSLSQVVVRKQILQENQSNMKQQDSDQREKSCQAFI
jgi:hypothetical protein